MTFSSSHSACAGRPPARTFLPVPGTIAHTVCERPGRCPTVASWGASRKWEGDLRSQAQGEFQLGPGVCEGVGMFVQNLLETLLGGSVQNLQVDLALQGSSKLLGVVAKTLVPFLRLLVDEHVNGYGAVVYVLACRPVGFDEEPDDVDTPRSASSSGLFTHSIPCSIGERPWVAASLK